MNLDQKLDKVVKRHEELAMALAAEGKRDAQEFVRLSKEYAELTPTVEAIRDLRKAQAEMQDLSQLMTDAAADAEMRGLAEQEFKVLKQRLPEMEQQLKMRLLPKDEADERNAILEVRAGTGGEEAALFAATLFRMYRRYAELFLDKNQIDEVDESRIPGYRP